MKIYLAADHSSFELKEKIKVYLTQKGYDVEDCGAYVFDKNDDYPDSSGAAAVKISKNPEERAIIFGGSGQGEAMTANKFPHVRCAVFYGPVLAKIAVDVTGKKSSDPFEIIRLTRQHNDANILSIAGRFTSDDQAKKAVAIFLETPFSNAERHVRRLEKIAAIEKQLHE